jgi:hypothetical protein
MHSAHGPRRGIGSAHAHSACAARGHEAHDLGRRRAWRTTHGASVRATLHGDGDGSTPAHGDDGAVWRATGGRVRQRQRRRRGPDSGPADTAGLGGGGGGTRVVAVGAAARRGLEAGERRKAAVGAARSGAALSGRAARGGHAAVARCRSAISELKITPKEISSK